MNEFYAEKSKNLPVKGKKDVVVIGGGMAGVAAAISAARKGLSVLIVEEMGFFGGMATGGWVMPMMSFHNNNGDLVISGIGGEIIDNLMKAGATLGHCKDTIGVAFSLTPYHTEYLKFILDSLFVGLDVEILFHTRFSDCICEDDKIKGIIIEDNFERCIYFADFFIDTTGDALLAYKAGIRIQEGDELDGLHQPMTLLFKVDRVNRDEIIKYMKDNPQDFHNTTKFDLLESTDVLSVSGFFSIWKNGNFKIKRDRFLFFSTVFNDEFLVNTTRISGLNPLIAKDLTSAEIEGRKQVIEVFEYMKKKLPGFKDSRLTGIAPRIGIREGRRIVGKYVLQAEDVINSRVFEDAVCLAGFPVDIHSPVSSEVYHCEIKNGSAYSIPLRSLMTSEKINYITAGRSISATFEAMGSTRLIPVCIATGQAAGTAVSIAHKSGKNLSSIDISELQSVLKNDNVILP